MAGGGLRAICSSWLVPCAAFSAERKPSLFMNGALGIEQLTRFINVFLRRNRAPPKCAKLVLGASAVHVRSRLRSRFFGVGPPKMRKKNKWANFCRVATYRAASKLMAVKR